MPPRTLVVLALLAAIAAPSAAQEAYTFTLSALGGLGGSLDEDDAGLDNGGFQVGFSMVTEPRTHVGARLGRLDFSSSDALGTLTDPSLTYLTLAGEYRFREPYYESGIYLGLGGYRLEGDRAGAAAADQTALGGVLGVTGEFQLTRRLAVLVEFAGHWADFDETQLFGTGHAGLAFHF